jgi:hypothetical protein
MITGKNMEESGHSSFQEKSQGMPSRAVKGNLRLHKPHDYRN